MQIIKHDASNVHFQGACFNKADKYIRSAHFKEGTNELIDKTIKNLSKTADKFERDLTIGFDVPSNQKTAFNITATDKKSGLLIGVKTLFSEMNGKGKSIKHNEEAVKSFSSDIEKALRENFSNGYDMHGNPILNKLV